MEVKKILLITFGVVVIGFIAALAVFNIVDQKRSGSNNSSETPDTYAGLPEKNRFVKETGAEIVDRFTSGSGVIFLGFTDCPWCQKAAPLLNEAADAENVSVYHLDIRRENEDKTFEYNEIITLLSPFLSKDENGSPRITTPDISIVKNGEIIWRYEIDATTVDERTPETYWTDERKERAIKTFSEQMRLLKEG